MRKFVVSSDDNLPCSLLVSLWNSACRALWVLMKSFLSRQWESLRSEEGHSAEKVKAHGICWVMSPYLAHRKTESIFLLSNLKFIKTSGKQTQEKLFQKHYTFRLPIPLKMKSVAMGVGGKEPPRRYRRLDQNVPQRQKALLSSLLNPLCWRGRAEDFSQSIVRVYITSRAVSPALYPGIHTPRTVSQGRGWLIVWSLDEERGDYVTCSGIWH